MREDGRWKGGNSKKKPKLHFAKEGSILVDTDIIENFTLDKNGKKFVHF